MRYYKTNQPERLDNVYYGTDIPRSKIPNQIQQIGLPVIIRNDHSLLYLDNLLERELRLNPRVLGLGPGFGLSFSLLDSGPSVLSQMPDLHRSSSETAIIHMIRDRFGDGAMQEELTWHWPPHPLRPT
jgi:hypothetical protein